jgi:hypothetical protein
VGEQKLEIDGETYWLRRLGAIDGSRFLVRAAKLFGPSLRSLALSDDAPGFILSVLSSDQPGKKLAELMKGGDYSVFALLYNASDAFEEEPLIELIDLVLVGQLTGLVGGDQCKLDDLKTYETVVGRACEKHGPFHQLKLLWAAVRANLGPTFGGGDTSSQTASATPE